MKPYIEKYQVCLTCCNFEVLRCRYCTNLVHYAIPSVNEIHLCQEWQKQSRGGGDFKFDTLGRCLADIQNEVEKMF